ncbi:glucose repression mediator protein [Coemansia aciculifera]|nr:glucose repression mediator protein [Coemansia aciculifera]
MQAHHQQSHRPITPSQIRQPMQSMSAGIPPPGLHASVQMGPPPNSNGQPNGAFQQGPPRGPPPHQGQPPPRQPRQPMQGQPPPPPPPQSTGSHHQQPPPPQQQSQSQAPPPPPPPAAILQQPPMTSSQRLSSITEEVWMQIGSLAELMSEHERALVAYDNALRYNPYSQHALSQIANIYRGREDFEKAVEYFQRIVNIDSTNGETWGAIGNCYLMLDEMPKAYHAYQQAIFHLPNPKEPKLWYGIGILYDRYGSYEHAEEAFNAVMSMDPDFDKANEIYFRLGIIHKCQGKYGQSLECFNRILREPPKPLTETDIWFQIGNVHELNSEFVPARDAYERVLRENPHHGKVLQQLGALYFRPNTSLSNIDAAVQLLMRAIEVDKDKTEAHTWYLLGRCYMVQRQYNKAYEAYQQAVYRDSNNANYWCSIGVLYYQINQYRDALDAYSRAIRISPYLSEVWFDLGALYEACNNQVNDAIDAYARAADLDRTNPVIEQRLELLRRIQATGQTSLAQGNPPPTPIDPPTTTTTTGQPNAPGGPAGESSVTGGAPGSLGVPPMSAGNAPPPMEHGRNPSDSAPQAPVSRGAMPPSASAQHAGHGVPPQYAQQAKAPHPGHAHMPAGRPGYPPEEHAYGRYEQMPRLDHPGADGPGPHYPGGGSGPPTSSGYPTSAPYQGAQYSQPMSQQHTPHPYNAPGHPQGSAPYSAHGQPPSSGTYRNDDVRMSSRHHSPSVPQQQQHQHHPHSHHQQQQQQQMHPQQSTPVVEQHQPGSAFQQGPVNGYGPYQGPPSVDARHRSRSPSRLQSPPYRHGNYGQPMQQAESVRHSTRDDRHGEQSGDIPSGPAYPPTYVRHGSVKAAAAPTGQPSHLASVKGPHGDSQALASDRDGDVAMEEEVPSLYKPTLSRSEPGMPMSSASGASVSLAAMSAAPISLPQISTPTPASDISVSSVSTPALSGPTAAPIRLPPVQLGGVGSFSNSGNATSSFGSVGVAAQSAFAGEDPSRSNVIGLSLTTSVEGPTSLTSARSAAEEDKDDFAINSLMSLSNVATTLTSRPQISSPPPLPPTFSNRASSEAVPTAASSSVDARTSEPTEMSAIDANGIKDLEISSPMDSKPSSEPVGPASADTDDSVPLALAFGTEDAAAIGSGNSRSGASSPTTSIAGGSHHESVGSNGSAPALVPSKRSLSATSSSDAIAIATTTTTARPMSPTSAGSSSPSFKDVAGGGSVASNNGNDGPDGAHGLGPRKRGRQNSPSPVSERRQPSATKMRNAAKSDDVEDGEEPEDGEVFEDEDMSRSDGTKAQKADEVVMGSGKVKHD